MLIVLYILCGNYFATSIQFVAHLSIWINLGMFSLSSNHNYIFFSFLFIAMALYCSLFKWINYNKSISLHHWHRIYILWIDIFNSLVYRAHQMNWMTKFVIVFMHCDILQRILCTFWVQIKMKQSNQTQLINIKFIIENVIFISKMLNKPSNDDWNNCICISSFFFLSSFHFFFGVSLVIVLVVVAVICICINVCNAYLIRHWELSMSQIFGFAREKKHFQQLCWCSIKE